MSHGVGSVDRNGGRRCDGIGMLSPGNYGLAACAFMSLVAWRGSENLSRMIILEPNTPFYHKRSDHDAAMKSRYFCKK